MAIQWGGWHGNLRVGIDVVQPPYDTNTTHTDFHVGIFVQCAANFNFSDNQTITLSGSFTGVINWFNGLQANQTIQVATRVFQNQPMSYGGGPTYTLGALLGGAFNGATPSVVVSYTLPARPARIPDPPSTPWFWDVTATTAWVDFTASPNNGGSPIIANAYHLSTSPTFATIFQNNYGPSTATGLSPGTTYYARSYAQNAIGWSYPSGVASFTTGAFATNAPTITGVTADGANVNWTAPVGGTPVGHDIEWARNSQLTQDRQLFTGPWKTSLRMINLTPGVTYYVRIRSKTETGYGAWSPLTSFTTGAFATQAPSITDLGPDAATAIWSAPAGAVPTGFEFQWARNSEFTSSLQTATGTVWRTSHRMTGLTPATRYYARVRSRTSAGYGAWSAGTTFETLSGAKVRRAGAWIDAPVFVRSGGQWKAAKVHKRVNGQWVL